LFKTIGLVSRLDLQEALNLASKIYQTLSSKGLKVVPEGEFARICGLGAGVSLSELATDLIVTVGGDGTVLKTSMFIPRSEIPILAVNMGRRGYLTVVEPEDAFKAVENCLEGKCRFEERWKLKVLFEERVIGEGLNEVLVTPTAPAKMLQFQLSLKGRRLMESRADALIVSTPTGSTGHALSAGGPIVDPSLDVFDLVLICPLEPIRSVVVPADGELKINLPNSRLSASVVVDGRFCRSIPPSSTLTVKRSEHKTVLVKFDGALDRSLSRVLVAREPQSKVFR